LEVFLDKDYVILKYQDTVLSDLDSTISDVEIKINIVDATAASAQSRLKALFDSQNIQIPKSNLGFSRTEIEVQDTVNAGDDYDELFINAFNELEQNGLDPSRLSRSDFLDEETLRRIDADATIPLYKQPNLDKYDYMISAFCGIISGLLDSFFVGKPGIKPEDKGLLQCFTDKQADNLVERFAKLVHQADDRKYKNALNAAQQITNAEAKAAAIFNAKKLKPSKITEGSVASAIGFLENRFRVNYDARYASDLLDAESLSMRPSSHHLLSLAHCPDMIGLFFSILDQFTGSNSFISNGKIVRFDPIETTPGFKLVGSNFIAKLFCGICNWLGHIISDLAGSSGTRGHINSGRGSGVPIPLFELFQLCDFGSLKVGNDFKSIAEVMVSAFEQGYDLRFAATMAIPVVLNDILIRLCWALKSHFYHKRVWKESIPVGDKPDLQRMILIGQGTLCLIDFGDAAIRSGGNALEFMLHLNIVAWVRVGILGYKEIKRAYDYSGLLDTTTINKSINDEWDRLLQESAQTDNEDYFYCKK
jgi:hypothetical protein